MADSSDFICFFPLQVGWDESTASERRTRVSIWEIEPVATPFYICPPPFFRPKLPKQAGMPGTDNIVASTIHEIILSNLQKSCVSLR